MSLDNENPIYKIIRPVQVYRAIFYTVLIVFLSACGASTPTPTATTMAIPATMAPSPTTAPVTEREWLSQRFGQDDKLTIVFYDMIGAKCLRYAINQREPKSVCADEGGKDVMIATQSVEQDSTGAVYSIIVGRLLIAAPTVVTLEMTDGSNIPVQVDGDGILVILEGDRRANRAVPINQFGNLSGEIFSFTQ